jgi:hypothetical protein
MSYSVSRPVVVIGLILLAALGAWTAASTGVGVIRDFSPVPFWDQWDGYLDFYMRSGDGWREFWRPHNEHRIVLSKLIFWADIKWFGGRNVLSLVSSYAALCALAGTFYGICAHYVKNWQARVALAGGIAVLMFSWVQWENLIWAFQNQWHAVFLFALLAFFCVERSANDRRARWIILALLCATVSMGSLANGLLSFPMLVVLGLFFRIGWPRVLLFIAVTALAGWAYLHGLHSSSEVSMTQALRTMPGEIARFFILYIGSPPWDAMQRIDLVFVCGAITLFGAALAAILVLVRIPHPSKINGICFVALTWFVVATDLATACGRVPMLGSRVAVASRYETAALVAWVSLLAFFAVNCTTAIQRAMLGGIWLAAAAIVVPYQIQAIHPLSARTFDLNVAGLALRAGIYDSPLTKILHPNAKRLEGVSMKASARRISLFSEPSPDYPMYATPVTTSVTCIGNIEAITKASKYSTLAQITGWAYGMDGKPPAQIVLTNPEGKPIGYGVAGSPRPDAAQATGAKDNRAGWLAFFAPQPDYVVVVISQDGRLCFIKH